MESRLAPTSAQISCMRRECEILFDEMKDEANAIGSMYQCGLLDDIIASDIIRTEINEYAETADRREFSEAIRQLIDDDMLPSPVQREIERRISLIVSVQRSSMEDAMLLRNIEDGGIYDVKTESDEGFCVFATPETGGSGAILHYESLSDFLEEWEDID